MADTQLTATLRTEFGKGAARRARRENLIPAVLYGHGTEPVHLNLPGHATFLIVRHSRNAVIELSFEGRTELALVKDVQVNPILRKIEHMDLVIVRKGEKVVVDVPFHLEGEPDGGAVAGLELQTLNVSVPATEIPERIVVNVEGLADGTIIRVADLVLPADVTTEHDPEAPVVVVAIPHLEETETQETADGEAGAAPEADAAE